MNTATDISDAIVDRQGTTLLDLARMLSDQGDTPGLEINDFKSSTANELRRFGEDLSSHLAIHAQVHVPPAYQLRSAGEGKIAVIGHHPDQEAIENYINNDTRLLKWFKEIEVLFEIQRKLELNREEKSMEGQVFNLGMTSLGSIAFFTCEK
ncbi:hypothetical protein HQ393_02130 [Chitinibacter bivalviorum]|uniref:Uncharacterized protein n=1 Tax=Chitinibacter bivalviorum TaxID=2739434 RepID=A0A7H9BEI2_9NEIS|nr:hypothetical protein [Chitinibacter bivalviorum]QLG87140.1 hypothetical protein HQ393_02130 [Chitinibacter bivalviorum]